MWRILLLSGAVFFCSSLWAGPAAWYRWHSAEGTVDICSQTSPGEGWVTVKGPFADALCKKPGNPG